MSESVLLKPEQIKLKVRYGVDNDGGGEGFFWPQSSVKRKEAQQVRRGSPDDFESVYQCAPGAREGSIFLASDFSYYQQPLTLDLGLVTPEMKKFCAAGDIFTAWDTAFSATSASAWTVGITGLLIPCTQYHCGEDPLILGECDSHYDVLILDVYRDKIPAGDLGGGLTTKIRQQHVKWRPITNVVENRASGIMALQALNGSDVPILGVAAKEGKRARAIQTIDGAGSAQGWFKLHRVLFPKYAPWLRQLEIELKDFTGDESATTDQVDAIVHLIVHAIGLGSHGAMLPSGWTPDRTEPAAAMEAMRDANLMPQDEISAVLGFLGDLPGLSTNPFESTCSECRNYDNSFCSVHHRNTTAFDICSMFESKNADGSYEEAFLR